jgi:hypothetical protein
MTARSSLRRNASAKLNPTAKTAAAETSFCRRLTTGRPCGLSDGSVEALKEIDGAARRD